jgi:deoxyadenosine/deoxycytidine kinase
MMAIWLANELGSLKRLEMKIGVVGPCAAGKTTLIVALRRLGFRVHHIAQEHSYVADMWERISKPDILIYLDVSYPVSMLRRPMNWVEADFMEQVKRLQHARKHASLYIDSDDLTPSQVLQKTIEFLNSIKQASENSG